MNGKIQINQTRCKGCEYCAIYCPKKCIEMSKDINVRGVPYAVFSKPELCIACCLCARMCPEVCIEVTERRAPQLYQKMEKTISKLIDSGLDKLREMQLPEHKKNKGQ